MIAGRFRYFDRHELIELRRALEVTDNEGLAYQGHLNLRLRYELFEECNDRDMRKELLSLEFDVL